MFSFIFVLGLLSNQGFFIEEQRFSLPLSADWQELEAKKPFIGIAQSKNQQALLLLKSSNLNRESESRRYLHELDRIFETHTLVSKEDTVVQGFPTTILISDGLRGAQTTRYFSAVFTGYATTFVITLSTPTDQAPNYEHDFFNTLNRIRYLGPEGFELNKALFQALLTKNVDFVKQEQLLMEGADMNARDPRGKTAFMHLVIKGLANQIQWLLEHGFNPYHPNHRWDMIQHAASPVVRAMVERCFPKSPKDMDLKADTTEATSVWKTPEHQLFSGIRNLNANDVLAGIDSGANLQSFVPNTNMTPLAYTRHLRGQFIDYQLNADVLDAVIEILSSDN